MKRIFLILSLLLCSGTYSQVREAKTDEKKYAGIKAKQADASQIIATTNLESLKRLPTQKAKTATISMMAATPESAKKRQKEALIIQAAGNPDKN